MTQYQAFARIFRPQTFEEVCEQTAIIRTLKNALKMQRVSHGYLFCGPRGVGKTTLARLLAKALNCHHLTAEMEPCNSCSSCKEITMGCSLDVLEIDGASNRGIDDIRQLNETTLYSTTGAKYKIYIIDEVHMLTKEAFNALLKTLEEPPENVKFFFATTEPHKIPPTILSRCQRFDLQRISLPTLCRKLKSILTSIHKTIDEQALLLLAHCADGSLRDGESLLDQIACSTENHISLDYVSGLLGVVSQQFFFLLDEAFSLQNLKTPLDLATSLYQEGKNLPYFMEMLADHYRTILKYILGAPLEETHPYYTPYLKAKSIYSKQQCLYILEYLLQWIDKFHRIPCKQIHLELILLHIVLSKQRISIDHLITSIKALQEDLPLAIEASKAQAPPPTPQEATTPVKESPAPPHPTTSPSLEQAQETLLRFAAIELNGTLKKGKL